MNPAESIAILKHFGYSEREAKFLYLVATHSGVFVQRQYRALGLSSGACKKLAQRALRNKDVKEHLPEQGCTRVYELRGQGIYGALGKEKVPRCKPGPDSFIRRAAVKLLTLDFVLAHPEGRYLEDQTEKVSYFVVERQINKERLPVRLFRGRTGGETHRYFPERFPMFLSTGSDGPVINFTYIEDETILLHAFSVFVRRYRPLFCALGSNFRLIFVSSSTRNFHSARKMFVKRLSATANGGESRKLASFFWVRKMAEEQRFEELADQDVADWRRGLKRYGDPRHEVQYQKWKQTGKLPEPEPAEDDPLVPDPLAQFETFLSVPSFD
jgi:hypothetical protein